MDFDVQSIFNQLSIEGILVDTATCNSGHINDTYVLTVNSGHKNIRYILQRINHHVFKDVDGLMNNISQVINHTKRKLIEVNASDIQRKSLGLVPCKDGKNYTRDQTGNYWRAYLFIEGAKTFECIENIEQAYQTAKAFGNFQHILSDLNSDNLIETIPKFHDTIDRYHQLIQAIEKDAKNRALFAKNEINFFIGRKHLTSVLLKLNAKGEIPQRITHNDTKLNNVMFDNITSEAVCILDLDTVMPGLALYDFGDLVRTTTNIALEDEQDLSKVKMDMPTFQALVQGYLHSAKHFLTSTEINHLAFSGKLITLEIGMRFLTDFLNGDSYFKTSRINQNLDRCRTQMTLVKSIEQQEDQMLKCVSKEMNG